MCIDAKNDRNKLPLLHSDGVRNLLDVLGRLKRGLVSFSHLIIIPSLIVVFLVLGREDAMVDSAPC